MDPKKQLGVPELAHEDHHKIRIILTSRNVTNLEKVTNELIKKAQSPDLGIKYTGPVRLPTKRLRITTRKSPCGEGILIILL